MYFLIKHGNVNMFWRNIMLWELFDSSQSNNNNNNNDNDTHNDNDKGMI